MVEIFVRPEWVTPTFITLLVITIIIAGMGIIFELLKKTRWTLYMFILSGFLFISAFAIFWIASNGLLNVGQTLNNPLKVSEEYKGLAVMVPDEMENIILENTDADKVMLDKISPGELFEILSNEDFVEFKALKKGQRIDGTLYFTEESMVINIAEEDNVEVIEVPAK